MPGLSNIVGIKVQSGRISFIAWSLTDLQLIRKMKKKDDIGSRIGIYAYHTGVQFSNKNYFCPRQKSYDNNISSFCTVRPSTPVNSRGKLL